MQVLLLLLIVGDMQIAIEKFPITNHVAYKRKCIFGRRTENSHRPQSLPTFRFRKPIFW